VESHSLSGRLNDVLQDAVDPILKSAISTNNCGPIQPMQQAIDVPTRFTICPHEGGLIVVTMQLAMEPILLCTVFQHDSGQVTTPVELAIVPIFHVAIAINYGWPKIFIPVSQAIFKVHPCAIRTFDCGFAFTVSLTMNPKFLATRWAQDCGTMGVVMTPRVIKEFYCATWLGHGKAT